MKYHTKTIVIFIIFLWTCLADAQVITGVVCDKATKQPISNVHVVLVGTPFNAVTDISGRFELKTSTMINTKMELRHVSYHTANIYHPFDPLPDTLYIEVRMNRIPEVTISAKNRNKSKSKIVKRTVIVEYTIEKDNSISEVKLIRSCGDPSIDALATNNRSVNINTYDISHKISIRKTYTFYFNSLDPPLRPVNYIVSYRRVK